MIRITDIQIPCNKGLGAVKSNISGILKIKESEILDFKIVRKSVDARKKSSIKLVYTVDVSVLGDEDKLIKKANTPRVKKAIHIPYVIPSVKSKPNKRPVIVGFGPAGIFCALVLAKAGLNPIVLERGCNVDKRSKKVQEFWDCSILDTECNVQFGEGGAGAFSDGKLNTGIKNDRINFVLSQFVKHGANENILYDSKPHVGTDVLKGVIKSIRNMIINLGGEVVFGAKFIGYSAKLGNIESIVYEKDSKKISILCDDLVLAPGHSARDTFYMLLENNILMEPKPFSMGVRIEHPQSLINYSQYSDSHKYLPNAEYKLNCRLPDGDSAYTFCMCPGGYVVGAASEKGMVATNGMSYQKRDAKNANSALLVTLMPGDFPDKSVLGGITWQREIEKKAFLAAKENYFAPAQLLGDFLNNKKSERFGSVTPTYKPGVTLCNLWDVLPLKISSVIAKAISEFNKKLDGFSLPDAVLTAPETRSSSPVRILRGSNYQSLSITGIYPAGEGAGYAGGIMSAAVDGMLCAEKIIEKY